jgi:hypothetical protein
MKKLSLCTFVILAATSVACSSNPPSGTTGTGGSGGGGTSGAMVLMPDANGFMSGTVANVIGAWYSYGDSYNTANANNLGDCQTAGFTTSQCSTATSPLFGAPFANTNGKMCLTGTAAAVIAAPGSTTPAYSAIWGVGIGFDFQNAGVGDAGASAGNGNKLPWSATANGITGFKFDISGVPTGGNLRVEFPFKTQMGSDAPYWGGMANNLSNITADGTYSFKWTDVTGPMYLTNPPPFDPTMIISAQFHVVSNTKGPITISNMCVSNVTLTQN